MLENKKWVGHGCIYIYREREREREREGGELEDNLAWERWKPLENDFLHSCNTGLIILLVNKWTPNT